MQILNGWSKLQNSSLAHRLNKDINSGDAPGGPVAKTYELPTQGGLGLAPGQGTGSHMLQLRVYMSQLKIPCVATKTQHSQINKYIFKTSSPSICSVLWGFLIAGNNSQNTFHLVPQRQNKALRNGAQIYLQTHVGNFWPQITLAHVSLSLNPQLRTRMGRICPQCGELLGAGGSDWSEGSRGQESRKRALLREHPASLSESPPAQESLIRPKGTTHWHMWRRREIHRLLQG